MTRDEAIEIRSRQLQGHQVDPVQAAEAFNVLRADAGTLTKAQVAYRKRKDGPVRARPTKAASKPAEPCPCGEAVCEPGEVVQALKPWALIMPKTEEAVLAGVHNPWPRPEDQA